MNHHKTQQPGNAEATIKYAKPKLQMYHPNIDLHGPWPMVHKQEFN